MASSNFPGRPFALRENVWLIRQEGNSSLVGWELWIDKRSTSPSFSDSFTHRWFQLDGAERGSAYNNGYDFRGGGPWRILNGETWMEHDAAGFKTFSIRGWANYDQLGATEVNSVFTLPRIPKVPQKPAKPSLSHFTPTSVRVNGSVPDDMGSGIQEWQFAASPHDNSGQIFTSNAGPIHDVQGLTPGRTYTFQYRARNGVGWSDWSDGEFGTPGLPAPTLTSWTQNTTGGLVARWTPPAATNGLTGYRVRLATDAEFTRNVSTADFGNVTSGTVVNLPGGRRYFAQVAALTAGGVNAYSNVLDTTLVLDAGNLDGWTRHGSKPNGISYYTSAGIRRGTVGTRQGLYLESLATGAVSIAANTTGMQRTIATTPGKAYRFTAVMTSGFPGVPTQTQGRTYRLAVGSVFADAATLDQNASVALPAVEFVATAQSTAIRILLADDLNVPGSQDQVEAVAFSQISVGQINTDYPQRLRSTVFESDLASHFDLACNSVGATWFVDTLGQTRFQLPGNALPVSAIFSDLTTDGHLNYVEPQAGYDIKSTVNRLEAENKGWDPVEDVELNQTLIYENPVSMDLNGTYTERVAINLYDLPPYEYAVPARLDEILDGHDEPELLVSSVRWNAQQDLMRAAALEVGQRVTVIFNGTTQDSQIVNLQHDITPTRWMITVQLQKLA